MSELLWVSVPSGRVRDGRPRLRIVVVPRLQAPLADVGMADWPAIVGPATLKVEVVAGGVIRPIEHRVVSAGRSDAWHAIFDRVNVRPFESRPAYDPPSVEQTSVHAGALLATYDVSARALSTPGPEADQTIADELAGWSGPTEIAPPPPLGGRMAPDVDFHRVVATLREHPTVLRALGLIIELELTGPSADETLPRSASPEHARIRVSWPGHPLQARVVPLWTDYEFDGEMFLPAGTGAMRDGLLDLTGVRASTAGTRDPAVDGIRWEVATIDVDGGVEQLRDAARGLQARRPVGRRRDEPGDRSGFVVRRRADPALDAPQVSVPAFRSGGLMLVQRERARDLIPRSSIDVAAVGTDPEPIAGVPVMSAADLVLGYRVDVSRQGEDRWLSLMQREATYRLGGTEGDEVVTVTPDDDVEEGHVKPRAVTQDVVEDAESDDPVRRRRLTGLRANEVVARWSGWSLATPRPVFDRSVSHVLPGQLLPLPFDLAWDMAPRRGSLPTLRFGTQYRLRVRIADIAGTGLELGDVTSNDGATELVAYQRYEPVASPVVLRPPGLVDPDGTPHPEIVGPGGTADKLVVRSDPAAHVEIPLHLPANDTRSILPPATTFDVIEQWGALDGADEQTWQHAARALQLTADGVPAAESLEPVADLPDPAAAGIAAFLHDIDDEPGRGQLVDKDWGPWPAGGARSVHLVAGPLGSAPQVEWEEDVLVVSLPPAAEAELELSSFIRLDELGRFAIKRSLTAAGELLAVAGRHPMVTPAHTVHLVHAVRRPLRDARGVFTTERAPGETTARLTTPEDLPLLDLDPASTLQLDLTAVWDDVVDDPQDEASSLVHRAVALPPLVLTRDAVALPELRLELGDTRNRLVTYEASAVGRFRGYFDDPDSAAFVAKTTLGQVRARSTARPPVPVVLSAVPAFVWSGREVMPGWSQTVGSRLVRTRRGSRVHLELARPWFLTGEGETLGVLAVNDVLDFATAPPVELRPFTSQVARDAVYDGIGQPPEFPDRWVTGRMLPGFGDPNVVAVTEVPSGALAAVRGYDVSYAHGRCFADIQITGVADHLYCPMVQLAVARFQPESLDGLSLSPVVRTDFIQLLPDRELVIERFPEGLQVTLNGLGPTSDAARRNRVDAFLERLEAPADVAVETVELASIGADAGGVPAWVRMPGSAVSGGLGVPVGILAVPSLPDRVRLVVKEVERFFVDDFGTVPEPTPGGELSERIVFTDVVMLT